jgi:hypothetical protein
MKKITNKFLNLFFNQGEEICFSANKYAYPSEPQNNINEEKTVLVAINPIKGQRKDENVTAYRTFMVECDDMGLREQLNYIKDSGFPFSYCCFSGNKSLHFALVLDHDIPSDHIYRHTYQWILNILEKADQKTKNPSRSIRFPNVIRPDTGKQQSIYYIGERISLEKLSEWLNKFPHKMPEVLSRPRGRSQTPNFEGIKPWVAQSLIIGIHNMEGSRNQRWMSIGCEFALNGYDLDSTIYYLEQFFQEQSDFKQREWLTAVKSGWNYADKIAR